MLIAQFFSLLVFQPNSPLQDFVVLSNREGQADLYRVSAGKEWKRLTNSIEPENYPKSTADGFLVFTTPVKGAAELICIDPQGKRTQLTHNEKGFEVMEPFFGQDGFVFYNRISNNLRDESATHVTGEIWQCKRDGSGHKKVIDHKGLLFNPVVRDKRLLLVANEFETYFDHPLALFVYDLNDKKLKRITQGFEAHGSWLDDQNFLAIHYQADEKDPLINGVYEIPMEGETTTWKLISQPSWSDNVRLPNVDKSGRFVLMTAKAESDAKPESAGTMSSYVGYQVWIYDRQTGQHKSLSEKTHAAEGAWFID